MAEKRLSKLEDSPDSGETFWEVVGVGDTSVVRFFFVCPLGEEPDEAQRKRLSTVELGADDVLDVARQHVLDTARSTPKRLRLGDEDLELLRRCDVQDVPLDLAEVTIYRNDEWFVRFASTGLGSCHVLGIGVEFVGDVPVASRCLDDSEEIGSERSADRGDGD